MIRPVMTAVGAFAVLCTPAAVQAEPSQTDRALAAGYKALFLCSAIANAERAGVTRTPESVHQWELTGIQAPLDQIVQDLPYEIVHRAELNDALDFVEVSWADSMPPRIAYHKDTGGCSIGPIGMEKPVQYSALPKAADDAGIVESKSKISGKMRDVFDGALGQEYGEGTRTTAVIVSGSSGDGVWDYAEGFGPATPQRTWSVAKSIAATLIGAAAQSADVSVDDPIDLAHWRVNGDPRAALTIDQMLRMASGRHTETAGNRTDLIYWGGSTVTERATSWPVIHKPGAVFRYANVDTLVAIKAIEPYLNDHAPAEFFNKVGMENTVAETDWQDAYVLSSQVWTTAPDLIRFGQLYLNNGVVNGERILPENWREYVSSPSGPQPEGRPIGYGAGFWLLNKSDGVPADTFAAMGNRGQYVVIIPSRDTVIVRRGEDPAGHRFDIAAFTRDVLAAQKD